MTPEVWTRVEEILEGALERPPAERKEFLDQEAGAEPEARRQVETLLKSEESAVHFIERPIFSLSPPKVVSGREEDLEKGSRIGAYRVLHPIGRGGMGTVYLAERADDTFKKQVAVKVLRRGRDSEEIVRRFRHERQILAQLDHPNIAKLLDGGSTPDGRPYFVMEYVQGVRIDHYCDQGCLTIRQRTELFRKVCTAVSFAHQNLVVHRDLKPGNILVNESGEPVLLDFGIAKLLAGATPSTEETHTLLTEPGSQPMTPRYASPEQIEGHTVTTASDVYSLGILLYEVLTGHRVYHTSGAGLAQLRRIICETEPAKPSLVVASFSRLSAAEESDTSPSTTPESIGATRGSDPQRLRRQLSGDLDAIVLKALRKERQHRYAAVVELSEDLRRHLEGLPVLARQGDLAYKTFKFVRCHRLGIAVALVFVLALFSLTMGVLWTRANRAVEDRDQALLERERALEVSQFLIDRFQLEDREYGKGETITARELLESAVQAITTDHDETLPKDFAALKSAIGGAYLGLGLFEEAEPHLQESLKLREQAGERHSAELVIDLINLSSAKKKTGHEEAAEGLFRRALAILEHEGGDSRRLEVFLNNRGLFLRRQGDLEAAERLFRESLNMKLRLYGASRPEIATERRNLATVLEQRGKYEEAEVLLRQILEQQTSQFGRNSAERARVLNALAILQVNIDPFLAGEAARESVEIRKALGLKSLLPVAQNTLATSLRLQGKYEEAENLYREVLETVREENGAEHRTVGIVQVGLATTLISEGRAAEAEPLARNALEIFLLTLDPDHWRVAEAESVLGASLFARGRAEEAAPLLERGHRILESVRGPSSRATREAQERLLTMNKDTVTENASPIPSR